MYRVNLNFYVLDAHADYLTPLVETLGDHSIIHIENYASADAFISYIGWHTFDPESLHIVLLSDLFNLTSHSVQGGIEILEAVKRASPTLLPIVIAQEDEVQHRMGALAAGAMHVVRRGGNTCMELASLVLRLNADARERIRRRQARTALYLFSCCVSVAAAVIWYILSL